MARHDHSVKTVPGFIVWDARNGRVQPAIGAGEKASDRVYTEADAYKLAAALNAYVLVNTNRALAEQVAAGKAEVKGPFYARPASKRGSLEGIGTESRVESSRLTARRLLQAWADQVERR